MIQNWIKKIHLALEVVKLLISFINIKKPIENLNSKNLEWNEKREREREVHAEMSDDSDEWWWWYDVDARWLVIYIWIEWEDIGITLS